jgi:hypothetical protein
MADTRRYIRNRDRKHFTKSELDEYKGVILTQYYGTIKKALSKGVPLYTSSGKLTHHPTRKLSQKSDIPSKKRK